MEYGILSIVPSIISIGLALIFKNVFLALIAAVFTANVIILNFNLFAGAQATLQSVIGVFSSTSNTSAILSMLLISGLIFVIEKSGGIQGFVNYLTKKNNIIKSKKGANIFTWLIGMVVFTTGTLSILITGAVSKPISKALKVPPEKSAFIIHSTSTPWSVLMPISLWAPFMMGLLQSAGIENAMPEFLASIPLNIYCIFAVFGTFILIITGKDFGPMKTVEEKYAKMSQEEVSLNDKLESGKPIYLVLPMLILIVVIIGVMLITGEGNIISGDGYSGILWGIIFATVSLGIMCIKDKVMTYDDFVSNFFKGCGGALFVATLLTFAFALGGAIGQLGAGAYLASVCQGFLSPAVLPLMIFLIGCLISFSTGTSLGTFSVLAPIAISMGLSMGSSIPLVAAAVWSGGIFGDHISPISDSSIISASITDCTVPEHIKTQAPYSLTYAAISAIFFLVMGFIL